jgi:hypothetical protein
MTKSGKEAEKEKEQLWCECDCANCEIGAHERCHCPQCHMPKWKDLKTKPRPNR